MVRKIVTYPHEALARKANAVDRVDASIQDLARDMTETMYENKGIGLAAPQVGEACRLITVDITGPEEQNGLIVLINPSIVSGSGETENEEGCLSLPGFKGMVSRYAEVVVKGLDTEGEEQTIEADGLLAVCLQHEIDHLDGCLLLDRVGRLKRKMYERKVKKSQSEEATS
jgi:peptide deformylase